MHSTPPHGSSLRWLPLAALWLGIAGVAQAQLARKPSIYEPGTAASTTNGNEAGAVANTPEGTSMRIAPNRRLPPRDGAQAGTGGASNTSGSTGSTSTSARRAPADLPALHSRAQFDQLARVHAPGTPLAQPHVLFVIDRQPATPRLYFLNTPRFQLHEHFLRARHWIGPASDAANRYYYEPDRRFLLGTLSWQPQLKGYTYEFWEGDLLTAELLRTAQTSLQAGFFAPLQFKANATAHEAVAAKAGLPVVTQAELIGQQSYLPLNTGSAVGRLRIVADINSVQDLQRSDILVLRQVPISLPPVAGVITERPSTVLSHVNLLAKGWGIPNAYVDGASQHLAALDGQWVHLQANAHDYALRAATAAERATAQRRAASTAPRSVAAAPVDLHRTQTMALQSLSMASRKQCGAKAANLGEISHAGIAGVQVPDGFCIPFGAYVTSMRHFDLAERVQRMRQRPAFASDAHVRRQALAQLRADMAQAPVDAALVRDWQQRWGDQLKHGGVFVRSSSSSEDLAHFSGAGLYTTVPNVRWTAGNEQALVDAVRQVWASVFNFEAWEARQAAGIDHNSVVMAVLVQQAVDSDASGVMVTRDPYGATRHATFIAAKRGLGIRVVEGQRVAEQVLYSRWSKAVQVLSRSAEDTELRLDPQGGLREVNVASRQVLNDERVRRLSDVGAAIEKRFAGQPQDIEWALRGEQILILQSRPFVTGTAP